MSAPIITLNDGVKIPKIGFGLALQTGYTYIDCAQMYSNSKSVKDALQKWGGKREDLFILQKCGSSGDGESEKNPKVILKGLLQEMGVDYVDLYLLHSPLLFAPKYTINEAWAIMEEIKSEGLAKSIGVSNFREEDLLELRKTWKVVPSIEFHPYNFHANNMIRLQDFCHSNKITIQCYGPLTPLTKAPGGPVDSVVKRIAQAKGYEDSQILLNWAAQKSEGVVVTTSANEHRQKLQLEAITQKGKLTQDEVNEISEAGKKKFFRAFMQQVWDKARQ
ncbi:hypothetical protein D1P53_003085 [Cryptococcus gattii VGV]|nr:hypothetical protein D1P53_003085 [Cryptococcus gattii VGV]